MWLFHPLGFASIVIDAQIPGNLLCRARVKKDLASLFPDHAKLIKRTPKSDYLFRVSVPRAQVAARITEMVEAIDYGNFKDACPRNRHDPYLVDHVPTSSAEEAPETATSSAVNVRRRPRLLVRTTMTQISRGDGRKPLSGSKVDETTRRECPHAPEAHVIYDMQASGYRAQIRC